MQPNKRMNIYKKVCLNHHATWMPTKPEKRIGWLACRKQKDLMNFFSTELAEHLILPSWEKRLSASSHHAELEAEMDRVPPQGSHHPQMVPREPTSWPWGTWDSMQEGKKEPGVPRAGLPESAPGSTLLTDPAREPDSSHALAARDPANPSGQQVRLCSRHIITFCAVDILLTRWPRDKMRWAGSLGLPWGSQGPPWWSAGVHSLTSSPSGPTFPQAFMTAPGQGIMCNYSLSLQVWKHFSQLGGTLLHALRHYRMFMSFQGQLEM